MKTTINFYMIAFFTSWSKRSLSRCRLMTHILCKWRSLRNYFEWVWVLLGEWDIILGIWEWLGLYGSLFWVGEALFWVSGGGWENILVGWGWVGWVYYFIMPISFMLSYIYEIIYQIIYFKLAFFYPHYELNKQAVIYVYI